MSDTFDRSQLDGKDREQLSEIASALGVKSISRMRKADLVEAIVTAAKTGNGASDESKPRKIRSTKAAEDDIASLAAEQDALASNGASGDDEMSLIRPRRRQEADGNGSSADAAPAIATDTEAPDSATPDGAAPGDRQRDQQRGDQQRGDQQRGDQQRGDGGRSVA
ncbi:MAG: Rho termination factor N-terminal domain-containing protein, partial [Actinomycetota bacterium]|nr:Rho termination factor N-terminal domain-containing protein [Actinomycetota bacterium]